MYEYLVKVKEIIIQNDFLKTFLTIGCLAFITIVLYNSGKVLGKLIADCTLF